jgi:alpha-N-acetylglucosaminidase
MFTDGVIKAVKEGKEFDEKAFKQTLADFEWTYIRQNESYPDKPKGDGVKIAKRLYDKYAPLIESGN